MSTMDMGSVSVKQDQRCCNLTSAHQFDSWKNVVLIAPDKTRDSFSLLALGLALVFTYGWLRNRHLLFDPDFVRLQLYIKRNPDVVLFDSLRLAFARGILNPKIY